jgi:hypothetical protein
MAGVKRAGKFDGQQPPKAKAKSKAAAKAPARQIEREVPDAVSTFVVDPIRRSLIYDSPKTSKPRPPSPQPPKLSLAARIGLCDEAEDKHKFIQDNPARYDEFTDTELEDSETQPAVFLPPNYLDMPSTKKLDTQLFDDMGDNAFAAMPSPQPSPIASGSASGSNDTKEVIAERNLLQVASGQSMTSDDVEAWREALRFEPVVSLLSSDSLGSPDHAADAQMFSDSDDEPLLKAQLSAAIIIDNEPSAAPLCDPGSDSIEDNEPAVVFDPYIEDSQPAAAPVDDLYDIIEATAAPVENIEPAAAPASTTVDVAHSEAYDMMAAFLNGGLDISSDEDELPLVVPALLSPPAKVKNEIAIKLQSLSPSPIAASLGTLQTYKALVVLPSAPTMLRLNANDHSNT